MSYPQSIRLQKQDFRGFPAGLLRLDYNSAFDSLPDWAMLLPPPTNVKTWAVVIHGHGSKGNQLYVRADIQRTWLPELQARGFGILTPTLRGNAWMSPAAVEDMDALLNYLRQEFGAEKFIFSSGSMGATSNLIYASLRPENVNAVIARGAICDLSAYHSFCLLQAGHSQIYDAVELKRTAAIRQEIADSIEEHYGGKPEEQPALYKAHSPLFNAEKLLDIPIFFCHGSADALMPVSQARLFAGALAEHRHFTYVELPDGNHDAPLTFALDQDKSLSDKANFSALDWVLS